MTTDWSGSRVLILGAARQGIALARWLVRRGARVTLSDVRQLEDLASARAALADLKVEWAAGGHPLDLLDGTDVLCLSGGVPLSVPIVREALRRGIPLSNDTQAFMEAVPCRTVGITGSAGKTTTTALVGDMARKALGTRAHLGGNIGDPLINYVDEMQADDLAILEISSFQLDQMTRSPSISAVLNITPNHLDRHGTMAAYAAAKARILEYQSGEDTAVLGRDDPGAWNLRGRVRGRLYAFSLLELEQDLNGTYLHDGLLNLRDGRAYLPLLMREKVALRGDHNVSNVLAAFAIGHAAGLKLDAMLEAVEAFRGVPHRLELVRVLRGVRWYNDSIATAPERSMAAIRSFDEPIVLMLGGRDKDLPWEDLAALVGRRVDHLVLFGEAAELIGRAVAGQGSIGSLDVRRAQNLREAVARAAEVAESGDIVLLSPGGTSFDEFVDFADRGEAFRKWVQALS
jgi:UDP-N-acetylmuramoylalanine--D-glutamate ligase